MYPEELCNEDGSHELATSGSLRWWAEATIHTTIGVSTRVRLCLVGVHSSLAVAVLLALVEAADSFAPARCWPAQPSVVRKAAAGSRIVLVDALEPVDDPRLDLKLS